MCSVSSIPAVPGWWKDLERERMMQLMWLYADSENGDCCDREVKHWRVCQESKQNKQTETLQGDIYNSSFEVLLGSTFITVRCMSSILKNKYLNTDCRRYIQKPRHNLSLWYCSICEETDLHPSWFSRKILSVLSGCTLQMKVVEITGRMDELLLSSLRQEKSYVPYRVIDLPGDVQQLFLLCLL